MDASSLYNQVAQSPTAIVYASAQDVQRTGDLGVTVTNELHDTKATYAGLTFIAGALN